MTDSIIEIKTPIADGVLDIKLPSAMNIQSFFKRFPHSKVHCWMNIAGDSLCVATADRKWINFYGERVTCERDVNPVILLNADMEDDFPIGKVYNIFGIDWVHVDDFYPVLMAVKPIAHMKFSNVGNTYATSDVKKFLENWLEKQKHLG